MIASVVATLTDDAAELQSTLDELASRPELDLCAVPATARRVPLTIDAPNPSSVEHLTDWIRSRRGVVFVDVVYVHLEVGDE